MLLGVPFGWIFGVPTLETGALAHFAKLTFFAPGTLFDGKWSPKGSQRLPKWSHEAIKNLLKNDAFFT